MIVCFLSLPQAMQTTVGIPATIAHRSLVIAGVKVGVHLPAIDVFRDLPGLDRLDTALFKDKSIRQLDRGFQDSEGNDLSGYLSVADAAAAILFSDHANARAWTNNNNQVNIEIAPSLTYVNSGHSSVSLLELTNNLYH